MNLKYRFLRSVVTLASFSGVAVASVEPPIITSIFRQDLAEVRRLLESGADPMVRKSDGSSGLDFALWGESDEIKKMVIEHQHADTGENELISKIFEKNVDRVSTYMNLGVNPLLEKNDGASGVDFAIWSRSSLMREVVLDHQNPQGETLLLKAVYSQNQPLVEKLLGAGARYDLTKHDGASVFDFAEWGENQEISNLLFENLSERQERESQNVLRTANLIQGREGDGERCQAFVAQNFVERTRGSRYHLGDLRILRWGKPSAPTFHTYHGGTYTTFFTKFPRAFASKLPNEIKDQLKVHAIDELDIFFVPQSDQGNMLLRPHTWVDQHMPDNFQGVRFERYLKAFVFTQEFDQVNLLRPSKFSPNLFNFSAHDGLISPDNAEIPQAVEASAYWSIVIDDDRIDQPKRAAVTLHWFLPHQEMASWGPMIALMDQKNLSSLIVRLGQGDHREVEALIPSLAHLVN